MNEGFLYNWSSLCFSSFFFSGMINFSVTEIYIRKSNIFDILLTSMLKMSENIVMRSAFV